MERALDVGSVDPEVVAVEARRSLGRPLPTPIVSESLAAFDRPAPSLSGYDALLEVG
jgi:hypothetical protein